MGPSQSDNTSTAATAGRSQSRSRSGQNRGHSQSSAAQQYQSHHRIEHPGGTRNREDRGSARGNEGASDELEMQPPQSVYAETFSGSTLVQESGYTGERGGGRIPGGTTHQLRSPSSRAGAGQNESSSAVSMPANPINQTSDSRRGVPTRDYGLFRAIDNSDRVLEGLGMLPNIESDDSSIGAVANAPVYTPEHSNAEFTRRAAERRDAERMGRNKTKKVNKKGKGTVQGG
jgi:hypothetical protein